MSTVSENGSTPATDDSTAPSTVSQTGYRPRYIDIGINLTDPMFQGEYHGKKAHENDLADVVERAKASGLEKLLVTGSDLEHSKEAMKLAEQYPGYIYATVGVHPCHATQFTSPPTDTHPSGNDLLTALKDLARSSPSVAAFGEIGLDYDRLHYADAETQRTWFSAQLDIAETLHLPLFLHSRAAAEDFEAALAPRLLSGRIKGGVVHSFTGTVEEMERLVALGLYIGINGCSLKTEENLEVVKRVPLDKLMLESDGPWCEIRPSHASSKVLKEAQEMLDMIGEVPRTAAVKKERWAKGKMVKSRNEPAATALVAVVVAKVKGVTLEEVCEAAWRNSVELLGLGENVENGTEVKN